MGTDASVRIAPDAAAMMRREISEAGGREVFFAGGLNAGGLVSKVRVGARGTMSAVNALFETLDLRDVVIHNHPGGNLEPSDADLELAGLYSHNGHGVFIVDNAVERVYVVIEPFLDRDRTALDIRELDGALRPDGPIARMLPQFEVRPQQAAMIAAVSNAFNEDGIAVVEAPTGVGKTLAYLLPAVLWAVRNRERVVISTRTINLQEQIVLKDIPLLQNTLKDTFTAVLVKGRQNYVCPRRLERALSESTLFDEETTQDELKAIAEWAGKTKDGSKSDLSFVPSRETWERICSESDTCSAFQCQGAGECFVAKARREIAKADIVVVNHHMLFSDLSIKKELGSFTSMAVLPAFKRLIIDEAHHIEDSATEYFGMEATRLGALALFSRFARLDRAQERGLLPLIRLKTVQETALLTRDVQEKILDIISSSVLPALASARGAVETVFDVVRSLASEYCGQIGREIKWRLTPEVLALEPLREIHSVYVLPAVAEIEDLVRRCAVLVNLLRDIKPLPDQAEHSLSMELAQLQAYHGRLQRLAVALAEGTSPALAENTVRWIEIDSQNANIVRIIRCPLDVGAPLAEWVYPNLKTLVMTSATLSVRQRFDFLFERIGLDRVSGREVATAILDSPFDFERQAILCVPEDVPAPDSPRFLEESTGCIEEILKITKGHAFVLFTSFQGLHYAVKRIEPVMRALGIACLHQGGENRTHLLDRFRRDASSCLFATDSFWEGVDVAGDALQCVILPKLPFRVPTEPILQARAEAIEASGGNAFMDYTVPMAVIKFRQGFGRLIRRRSDRGSVVVLDSRILTKRYGKVFLESLPKLRVVSGPRKGALLALRNFHDTTGRDTA